MAAEAEPSAGSASAATEHTEEPQLAEVVTQEAGLSTEIELKVIRNDLVHYKYTLMQGKPSAYAESTNRSAVETSRAVLLGYCKTPEKRRNRA